MTLGLPSGSGPALSSESAGDAGLLDGYSRTVVHVAERVRPRFPAQSLSR